MTSSLVAGDEALYIRGVGDTAPMSSWDWKDPQIRRMRGFIDQVNEDTARFLQDGMEVSIEFYDEKPMNVNPPEHLVVEIAETEAVVKGQTASSSYKPAILTNGARVTVPPHIETGDKIKINSKELTYIEKSK